LDSLYSSIKDDAWSNKHRIGDTLFSDCQIISNRLCQNVAFVLGSYQPFHFTVVCFLLNVPNTNSDYTELNGSIIYESTGKDEEVSVA